MEGAVAIDPSPRSGRWKRWRLAANAAAPSRVELILSVLSSVLLVLAFPDFNLWPIAWVALVPLLIAVVRRPSALRGFLLGWITGALFFYGSVYWLTFAMIRYGGIPSWVAYLLILIPTVIAGIFPALFCLVLAKSTSRWGPRALFVAPALWATFEWARLGVIGQLWNAIAYSQAYRPELIQPARWGGVYLIGFLILTVNAAIAYAVLKRTLSAYRLAAIAILSVTAVIILARITSRAYSPSDNPQAPSAVVIAVQPNVPMDDVKDVSDAELLARHVSMSETGLASVRSDVSRLIIWPESPMYFRYGADSELREFVRAFTTRNRSSLILNSLEPAPSKGSYNSAVMVKEDGQLSSRYDKIRLLPFGEYVPMPRWLPGVNLIPTMVGDFTPGENYTLMQVGDARAGVFICFESAFPYIARRFTKDGADILVNISNDGYLGPTAVMWQHVANTVFRAVENNRPVVRVTNTGISAFIAPTGEVLDATEGYRTAVRTWQVNKAAPGQTFYTKCGDVFVWLCALMSAVVIGLSWRRKRSA